MKFSLFNDLVHDFVMIWIYGLQFCGTRIASFN
jgi:hypothetical protein